MNAGIEAYRHLWETPDEYYLLAPYGRSVYTILERPSLSPIGIGDPEVEKQVAQKLIDAGAKILDEDEFFELRVQDCSYLWEDEKDDYVLVDWKDSEPPRYGIASLRDGTTIRIEHEDIREEVIARMLKANMRVVTKEEFYKL